MCWCRSFCFLFLYLFIVEYQVFGKNGSGLPFHLSDEKIVSLRKLLDQKLQRELDLAMSRNKTWARLLAKRKMAVGVVDLSDSLNVRFARINGDVMMYAASLPKLAVLLAAMQSFEDGSLQETEAYSDDLRIMISRSDNGAASRMIDVLGFKKIEAVLSNPHYQLYDPKSGGGLWVGKRYAKKSKRYPDPLMGLSHGATVTQVCRYYYLLAMGKLVNRHRSEQMLEMLVDPEIHHKFVSIFDQVSPEAKLYRKSGTWKQFHSDSVMIWGPEWRRYIVVALVEDVNGEQILRDLIPAVDGIMKSISQNAP
ncbi:serine hydrolase [candidate division KSB1 bacterium]|nr:serine hydrolase [candidate division KSB1 bacterium]